MRVKLQNNLQPHEQAAHSVVVEDDLGNPIYVAVQHEDHIICAHAGEADFHNLLRVLGITKTVIVNDIAAKPIEKMLWKP